MVFSLVAIPIAVLLGGATDLMRYASARSELQGAIDSGVLAASQFDRKVSANETIKEYLRLNIDRKQINPDNVTLSITEKKVINKITVDITASTEINTYFLSLIGRDKMKVTASTQATQEYQAIEVSLVLDISSSMRGTRLINLRNATKDFIDAMFDDGEKDLTSISIIPFGGAVNTGNQFQHLIDMVSADSNNDTDFSDGHMWNGCFELKPSDYNDSKFTGTRDIMPHFWKYVNFNPWCPEAVNEAIFLSNDVEELKDLADAFTLSDGTGMDIGAAWGLKALSPKMRGEFSGEFSSERPAEYNDDTLKVLVLMTDGGITPQYRPTQSGCIRARNRDFRFNFQRWCQTLLYNNVRNDRHDSQKAVSYFNSICQEARRNNIIVYTIGFQIRPGSNQDRYLSQCPQSVSHYYLVEDTDISKAFSSIAASISGIRLTQ